MIGGALDLPTLFYLPAWSSQIKHLKSRDRHSHFFKIKSDILDKLDVILGITAFAVDAGRLDETGFFIFTQHALTDAHYLAGHFDGVNWF
jgi:hypothetical protein